MWQKVSCNAVRRKIFVQNIGLLERERERTERLETGKGEKAFTTLSFKVIIGVGWLDGWLAGWCTPIKDPFPVLANKKKKLWDFQFYTSSDDVDS